MGKLSSPTYKIIRRNGGGCAVRIDTPNEKPVIVSGFQTDREAQAWIDRPGLSPRRSPDGTRRQKSIRSLLWPMAISGLRATGPEPWNAHVKDKLEDRLHALVCAGKMSLPEAQRAISSDWISAYKQWGAN